MKQHNPTTKRHVVDPKRMMRFLAEVSPCGAGEEPSQVVGWSKHGKWTRIKATHPNGWEMSVNFDRQERVSSWSEKMSAQGQIWNLPQGSTIADSVGNEA